MRMNSPTATCHHLPKDQNWSLTLGSLQSSSDQWTPEMVQPNSFRYSSIYVDDRECIEALGMDTLRNEPTAVNLEHMQSTPVNIVSECSIEELSMGTLSNDDPMDADVEDKQSKVGFKQDGISSAKKVIERNADQQKEPKSSSTTVNIVLECIEDLSIGTLSNDPMATDTVDVQGKTGFNQDRISAAKEIIEQKADKEKEKSSSTPVNVVSLTEYFTSNQIMEHIMSLRNESNKLAAKYSTMMILDHLKNPT